MSAVRTIAVVLALPTLAAAAPRDEPPSSLEPGAPQGRVTFQHEAKRVTGCTKSCLPKTKPVHHADALAFRLTPVRARKLVGKDARQAHSVNIPAGTCPVKQAVQLRVGEWQPSLPGDGYASHFVVRDGDDFTVRVTSFTGECVKQADQCVLDATRHYQSLRVPSAHAPP